MSRLPEVQEDIRPLAPGYSPKLIELDAQMVALGRPLPPVVSWIRGGLKGDFNARTAAWRKQVEAWEVANPMSAVQWAELKAQCEAEEERLDAAKWSEAAWRFELMQRLGFPPRAVELCRAELRDTEMFTAARDWMRDGLTWSVVLTGGPGCGKTVAATWAAHQLLSRNFRPFWVSCPRMSESNFYDTEGELRRFRARNAGVLVLDDLGEGRRELESKPWAAWLDDVLTERHAQRRKTIITTNRTAAELRAFLGERIRDRLNEGHVASTKEKSMRGAK